MAFWREWTEFNCRRLNALFAEDGYKFSRSDLSDRLIAVKRDKRVHTQPVYFCDSLESLELNRVSKALCESGNSNVAKTYAIPSLAENYAILEEKFLQSYTLQRSPSYWIELQQRSEDDLFRALSPRQRSKIRGQIELYEVSEIELTQPVAALFEEQQFLWGVSKQNYFRSKDLLEISKIFTSKIWRIESIQVDRLYIFTLEAWPEAYFFLSAHVGGKARSGSLIGQWEIIRKLAGQRFVKYHLGGGKLTPSGLDQFKKSLGASQSARYLHAWPSSAYIKQQYFPSWLSPINRPFSEAT